MFPIKQIISPTDFSKPSLEGLRNAAELAEKFDAEMVLLHVIEPPNWPSFAYMQPTLHHLPDMMASIKEEALQKMTKIQSELIPGHIRCRMMTLEGSPPEEIVNFAAEQPAGMIVIATHGYSGFHRFIFGSVTERVVRTSTCPVLTIRPKNAE